MTSIDTIETVEQRADRLVRQEVLCCLSSLVNTLAAAYGTETRETPKDSINLHEQAMELSVPVADYAEAAIQVGWTRRAFDWVRPATAAEIERYGLGDGLCHVSSLDGVVQHDGLDPSEREVYEHWAVTEWFGKQLQSAGERVDFDFAGLVVWARTTTGQAISADGVVEKIAKGLLTGD